MSVVKQTNWTKFKQYVIDRNLSIQYINDDPDIYELYAIDGGFVALCIIKKDNPRNLDQVDFEDNYQANCNKPNDRITGGTNRTLIGNTGDRLKVDANINSVATGALSQYPNKLRHLDINVANGGIARNTTITNATWVDVFSYTGSGSMASFFLNLEHNQDWQIRLLIDGQDVFGPNGMLTNDFLSSSIYNISGNDEDDLINILSFYFKSNGNFIWTSPLNIPTQYTSSVTIKLKRNSGANSKKFQAGLVTLTKET